VEAERGPCTTTSLVNLHAALQNLLEVDGAEWDWHRVPATGKRPNETCVTQYLRGGNHETQLAPALEGLTNLLGLRMITCHSFSALQVHFEAHPVIVDSKVIPRTAH